MKRHLASAGAIVVLALAGYGFLLAQPRAAATAHSDLVTFHLGMKQVLYNSLHAGRGVPFWRSDQLGGAPAFTDPQAQYLLPLHFLFWLLPPAQALGPTLWLELITLSFAAYTLGGALKLGTWPRLFLATAALFSTKVVLAAYAGWLAYLSTVALLPLLFAAVISTIERPRLIHAAVAASAGALCLLSGMAQLVYYALFFLAAIVAAGKASPKALALLGLGALLAAGIAACQLVPFLSEASLFSRGQLTYEAFLAGHGRARQLLTLLLPTALGTPLSDPSVELWEDSAHFGTTAFVLALVGVSRSGRRPWAGTLTAFFATALLLSFDSPVLRFLHGHLPGMDRFRIPSRMLFLAALFGACLAGIGLERLVELLRGRRALALGAAAVALASLEGALEARRYFASPERDALAPSVDYARFFAADPGVYRIAPLSRSTINAGWAEGLGVELVTGYNPLTLRHYQRYLELLQFGEAPSERSRGNWTDLARIARPDLLDALGVRYVIAPLSLGLTRPATPFPSQPIFVFYQGMRRRDLGVYRNPGELPRARWVDRVLFARDDDEMASEIGRSDLRATAVLLGTGGAREEPLPSSAETVQVSAWAPGEVNIATRGLRERFLLVSEVWHPGWTASIDGHPAAIVRADLAFLGLWVPAGPHRIELRFRALHVGVSLAISAASALAALLLAAIAARRSRRGSAVGAR